MNLLAYLFVHGVIIVCEDEESQRRTHRDADLRPEMHMDWLLCGKLRRKDSANIGGAGERFQNDDELCGAAERSGRSVLN